MKKQENLEIEKVTELLKNAPTDDGTVYGVLYDLYFFINIAKGIEDIKKGRGTPIEELDKEMEELYENTSRRFG